MPGENVAAWSTTAASNATADTSINWAEGQPRASVNDSARSLMAAIAKERDLQNGSIVTGGTANAQTFSSGIGYTAVPSHLKVLLVAGFTNTGTLTVNMDGIGPTFVYDQNNNQITSAGAFVAGSYVELIYDGTHWRLINAPATGVTGAFIVNRGGSNQTGLSAGYNKVQFNTEVLDSNGWFDTTTFRFTPLASGTYLINLAVQSTFANASDSAQAAIYKNGTRVNSGSYCNANVQNTADSVVTAMVQMNGTTDYIEGFCYVPASGAQGFQGATDVTFMSGFRIGS